MTDRSRRLFGGLSLAAAWLFVSWLAVLASAAAAEPADDGEARRRLTELSREVREASTPADRKALAFEILPVIDDAIRADDYATALRLASLAVESARKAGNNHALTLATARRDRATTAAREFKKLAEAFETLGKDPNDPRANSATGRFACFVKGDWDTGLPRLARGADARLKALAVREREEAAAEVLAEGWLEAAEAEPRTSAAPLFGRAYHWAREVPNDAPEDRRAVATKVMDRLPMRYLTDLEQVEAKPGPWPVGTLGRTGAPDGAMIAVNGLPSPDGIGMHPPDSGFASAKYRLDGRFEVFESGLAISDHGSEVRGACVFVVAGDGKVLWTSRPVRNWGDAEYCRVGIKGVRTLELRTLVQGEAFGTHAVWLDPSVSR